MGFWRRIFGGGSAAPAGGPVNCSSGQFGLEIVGESHYLHELRRAKKSAAERDIEGREVILVRVECEPTNQYDPLACRVVTLQGVTIGYLSRAKARGFHNAIKKVGGSVSCRAVLVGGDEGRENIGAWLDLCRPWEIPGVKKP